MSVAELVITSSETFDRFYLKVTDQDTNLVIYSASLEESLRLLREVGELPGLYILQADDGTVYVGQSKALGARLKTHRMRRKIGFTRIFAMVRDQRLAQYLDYAEAKIYGELSRRGFRLEQSQLTTGLEAKRGRLHRQDQEHVCTADRQVSQFLQYAVALGLAKPMTSVRVSPDGPAVSALDQVASPAVAVPAPVTVLEVHPPSTETAVEVDEPARTKRKSVKLSICDAKGVAFQGKHSSDIFVAALQHLGLARIFPLGLKLNGHLVVAREKPGPECEAKLVDGWYVSTHSNNATKARILEQVSDSLAGGLTVVYHQPVDRS